MAKNDTGLTQLSNGHWQYRIKIKLPNGTKIDTTCRVDEAGEPFYTKTAARDARMAKLVEIKSNKQLQVKRSCTFNEVWSYYKKNVAPGQAPSTQAKHDSVWRNHIAAEFGNRDMNDVTVADINSFLVQKYNTPQANGKYLSFAYLESFVKLFFLLYGIANRWGKVDINKFSQMFLIKKSKITMPKMKHSDELRQKTVKVYEQFEIAAIENTLKETDGYIAFLLGFFCGVRISECYGILWSDINWDTKELTINKQMQVINGIPYLRCPKTKAANRTIAIPDVVMEELCRLHRIHFRKPSDKFRINKSEKVIDQTHDREVEIIGGDFVNRRTTGPFEGTLMTSNSMKMYSKEIKARNGIHFEYHTLRKTHITCLINLKLPLSEIAVHVGHSKVSTTLKSYAGSTEETKQIMRNGVNSLNTIEPMVEITAGDGSTKLVKQSEYFRLKSILASIPH